MIPQLGNRMRFLQQSEIRNMTLECTKVGGLNLSQGVCDTPVPEPVRRAAQAVVTGSWVASFGIVLPTLVTLYSAGAYAQGARAWFGYGFIVGGLLVATAYDIPATETDLWNGLFFYLLTLLVFAVGDSAFADAVNDITWEPGTARFEDFEQAFDELYAEYTFDFAAHESGVDAATLERLADVIASAGSRLSTHNWRSAAAGNLGGWQVSRALFMLNALLGAIAVPGGTYPNAWNKYVPKPIHVPPHPDWWKFSAAWPACSMSALPRATAACLAHPPTSTRTKLSGDAQALSRARARPVRYLPPTGGRSHRHDRIPEAAHAALKAERCAQEHEVSRKLRTQRRVDRYRPAAQRARGDPGSRIPPDRRERGRVGTLA
jgi:hypothetical protein